MQFTAQEAKLIERLRKRERRWPRDRWLLLVGAIFLLAGYGYILAQIIAALQSDTFSGMPEVTTLLFAIFWPKCLFGFCLAGLLLGLAFRDWHGNVHRMLLLRLLDEQQKKDG